MRNQVVMPLLFSLSSICRDSVQGTRGSFFPTTAYTGLRIFSELFSGAVFSRYSRVFGSRSSPYSTRRRSRRYASVCSSSVTRFDGPTIGRLQQILSLYSYAIAHVI